jgi:hypothetical protein
MRFSRQSHATHANLESEKRSASAITCTTGRLGLRSLSSGTSVRAEETSARGILFAEDDEISELASKGIGMMRFGVCPTMGPKRFCRCCRCWMPRLNVFSLGPLGGVLISSFCS